MYSLITSLTDYKDIFVHFSKTTERIFKILFANPPVMLGNTGRHTGDITLWILSTVAFFVNTCYVVAHCATPPISISNANCSAHRHPTEMRLYFLESSGQGDSKKYRLISVDLLCAEQFAFKHRPIL